MKWALLVVVVLVAVIAVVVIVGFMLPRAHVAVRRARFSPPPAAVWAVITDFAGAAAWRSDLKRVEMLPDLNGQPAFREHGDNGVIAMQVVEQDAPRRLVTRIADPDLPFGGTWTWDLAPGADGTQLTITEHGEVKNPVFRFLSRFVFGHTATLDRVLTDLGKRLESGTGSRLVTGSRHHRNWPCRLNG